MTSGSHADKAQLAPAHLDGQEAHVSPETRGSNKDCSFHQLAYVRRNKALPQLWTISWSTRMCRSR